MDPLETLKCFRKKTKDWKLDPLGFINPEWRWNFLDPSKNRLLKLQTAIFPKLFNSDKRFIQRSKAEHRGFQINF